MTDENNRLTLSQLKQLLRLYIRRGASANFKVTPQGDLEAVPDKDTDRRKDATIPAELLPLLEQLGDDGKIPPEWQAELKRYHEQLQQLENDLSPEERASLEQHREQTEAASESQLKKMEQAEELLPDAVRNTLEQQRRLRQSLAGKATQAWKQKHMPEDASPEEGDGDDDGEPDPNQKSKDKKKKDGKPQQGDKQQQDKSDKGDDGDQSDSDDADGDSQDDSGQPDNADGNDGDDGNGNDSSNADSPSQDSQSGQSQQGKGDQSSDQQQSSDGSDGGDTGDGDAQPEDSKEGLDKYREELEKKAGDQGKGDDDDNSDGDGDGEGQDGDSQDGENQNGDNQQGKDQKQNQNQKQEDSSDGLKNYEKELRKKQQEEQQKSDQQKGQEGQGQQGQGQPGQQPGQQGPGQENAESSFGLSDMKANDADVYDAKKALERLLARGRKNPQQLPRWNKRELVERLAIYRNPNPARKPTLEQKAILMVIDNSPSMAHLEKQSRALAAALSAAGGPNGATVIVCLSSNGDYTFKHHNPKSEDGLWFVNGKCMGRMPEPPQNGGFNPQSAAQTWAWFIKKYLPQRRYDVHIIGVYGDRDGAKRWSYISNACKGVMCTWFNPEEKGQGGVQEIPNMGKHRVGNASYGDGWGIMGEPGYVAGDKRYETFRGKYFIRVDTIRDIATALKKAIGL